MHNMRQQNLRESVKETKGGPWYGQTDASLQFWCTASSVAWEVAHDNDNVAVFCLFFSLSWMQSRQFYIPTKGLFYSCLLSQDKCWCKGIYFVIFASRR